jgi:hypothetical protein
LAPILSVSNLKRYREWKIASFVFTFSVSSDVALIILEHFNWKDEVMTGYIDRSNDCEEIERE